MSRYSAFPLCVTGRAEPFFEALTEFSALWSVLVPSTVLARVRQTEGKMSDWVPVIIVAVVVGGVTVYLLTNPKLRGPRKDR
jgi:hypothetical protein